jgi:ABC-2 type transport system ATP-binding protein
MRVGQYLRRVAGLYENWRNPDDLLELVGLSDASEKRVSHLSAGMRQRLGIAQAMVGRPELLFLDEPTSNLDVPGRWDVLQMILRIHNETGATFFICSHILSELERVCTHVAFLVRGRLIDSGALPDILKKHTANLYRVAVSDVRILLETVRQLPGVVSAEVSGTTTVDVLTSKESAEDVRKQIMQTVERLNLQLYGFDKASTLEQAFWEATRDEKHN